MTNKFYKKKRKDFEKMHVNDTKFFLKKAKTKGKKKDPKQISKAF